jgi:hypothetical protein
MHRHSPRHGIPRHAERLPVVTGGLPIVRVNWKGTRMEHIPTAISTAALIGAFIAVSLVRRTPELPKDKEKKVRKKRQAKEEPQQA